MTHHGDWNRDRRLYSRLIHCLGGLALLCAVAADPAGAEQALRVLTQDNIFSTRDDQGQLTGFEVEIARALCATMHARCDIAPLPFADVLAALDRRAVDFAVASILKTPERQQKYLFTDRYWRSNSSFVARTRTWPAGSMPSLIGLHIAVNANTKQDEYIQRNATGGIVMRFGSPHGALQAVAEGRADICLVPTIFALQFMMSVDGRELETVGDPVTGEGLGGDVAIALPPGHEALRDDINQALRTILSDGRYDAISSRFLPFRLY